MINEILTEEEIKELENLETIELEEETETDNGHLKSHEVEE